jgi:carboxypeptidase family protein
MNSDGTVQVRLGEGADPSWGIVPTFATAPGAAVTVGTDTTSIQFSQVTVGGATTINPITPIYADGQTPSGYTTIAGTGVAFDISTTASYAQPVTICLTAPAEHANNLNFLFIAHHENGRLVVKPTTRNGLTRKLCAQVNSLSPFVILQFVDPSKPQITGVVVDAAGNPIPRVTLELNGAETRQTLSDINGKFTFANLTSGASYSVTAFDDRYDFTPPLALLANLTGTNTLVFVAQPKTGPPLKITAIAGTPGRFNLTWTVSPVEYVLEFATSLNPFSWTPATEQPSLVGNNLVVSVQATSATRYFRLRRP